MKTILQNVVKSIGDFCSLMWAQLCAAIYSMARLKCVYTLSEKKPGQWFYRTIFMAAVDSNLKVLKVFYATEEGMQYAKEKLSWAIPNEA